MSESECCPRCNVATVVNGQVGTPAAVIAFIPDHARPSRSLMGVALKHGACLSCGHVWTYLDPSELRRFIKTQTKEPGRRPLDEIDRGPYPDLPGTELSQEIGLKVAEIDALVRSGNFGKAVRRYRELRGVTWDQAIKDAGNWAELKRPAKLALFGWAPKKEKEPFDDLL